MSDEPITMTKTELDTMIQTEVNKQRLQQLGAAFKQRIISDEVNWSKVHKKLDDVPLTMQRCRDDIEKDMKNNFLSIPDAKLMESRLESKVESLKVNIESLRNRITWTVGTIVAIATVAQYIINTYVKIGAV